MSAEVSQRKIDDCRGLYLKYGGKRHESIVREMRTKCGWLSFTKRNLYARTRGGVTQPGWPERFGWDGFLSGPRAIATGFRQRRSRPGIAYANRSASVRAASPRSEMRVPFDKFNRQKARRLRRAREREAGNTRALACNAGSSGVTNVGIHASSGHRSGDRAGEGARAPGGDRAGEGARAPDDFHVWLKTLPGIWTWDWRHQLYLYKRLKRVTDGVCRRLMIFMPPRHGKSELVTVRYSAWRLKRDPSLNVILGSYNQRLANRFSRKIRRVLADDWSAGALAAGAGSSGATNADIHVASGHRSGDRAGEGARAPGGDRAGEGSRAPASPFPFTTSRPANSVAEWETTQGGGLRAVGVGGGVTGYGASLIVIDDPVKSREQANSEVFREKIWDWFNDDLYTRLEPNGAIVLIQTRWHEDDLAGRLLKEMEDGGEQWEIVNLPALAETAKPIENGEWRMENEDMAEPVSDSQFSIIGNRSA